MYWEVEIVHKKKTKKKEKQIMRSSIYNAESVANPHKSAATTVFLVKNPMQIASNTRCFFYQENTDCNSSKKPIASNHILTCCF